MAHAEQQQWCAYVKQKNPRYFVGQHVLDIGSLDVNGNNRGYFEGGTYLGIDLGWGPNVDLPIHARDLVPLTKFGTVISTEAFEHDEHLRSTLVWVVTQLLESGGLFLFTCAAEERHEHGTTQWDPAASPFTNDFYRNVSRSYVEQVIDLERYFREWEFGGNTLDLYFWGILR